MREEHPLKIGEPYFGKAKPRQKLLVPALLFLVTIVTTVTAGALFEGVNPFEDPGGLVKGIPFSASILLILGTHELGQRYRFSYPAPRYRRS
jgi:hypothetical protein